MKKVLSVVLVAALVTTGCASAAGPRVTQAPAAAQGPVIDQAVLADYVQRLPAGSKVRVERVAGSAIRGTLMKATDAAIVVQQNTRIPEAPIDLPLREVTRVTLDSGSSTGRSIGIGVATGVGATFGVLLLLAALLGD